MKTGRPGRNMLLVGFEALQAYLLFGFSAFVQGMERFSGAVVHDDKRCHRISPPPSKEGVEDQTNEDGAR